MNLRSFATMSDGSRRVERTVRHPYKCRRFFDRIGNIWNRPEFRALFTPKRFHRVHIGRADVLTLP